MRRRRRQRQTALLPNLLLLMLGKSVFEGHNGHKVLQMNCQMGLLGIKVCSAAESVSPISVPI